MSNLTIYKSTIPKLSCGSVHFYTIVFDDVPDQYLLLATGGSSLSVHTFAREAVDPLNHYEQSSTLDILVTTGLTERNLYNIYGILGPDTQGTLLPDKIVYIPSQDQDNVHGTYVNYETLELQVYI